MAAVNRPCTPVLPSGPDRTARCGPARLRQWEFGSEWAEGCGGGRAASTSSRRAAVVASLPAGLGAVRNRQPNFAGGARSKPTRSGRAGVVGSRAETGSRISPALLVRKQPGAAVLVAEVSHRPPSLNKFRVDRHNPRFAGLILSRAGVRPARDKINPAKRGPPETPFHPNEYLNSKINFVTGWG